MSDHNVYCIIFGVFVAVSPTTAIFAANQADPGKQVIQSVPPGAPVHPPLQKLKLNDAQRTRIRQILATKDTEVSFDLKETKDAKSFQPKVNAKLPKGLKAEAFPQPLNTEIPQIRNFGYLKFKNDILIIDLMTDKVVDMFPQKS